MKTAAIAPSPVLELGTVFGATFVTVVEHHGRARGAVPPGLGVPLGNCHWNQACEGGFPNRWPRKPNRLGVSWDWAALWTAWPPSATVRSDQRGRQDVGRHEPAPEGASWPHAAPRSTQALEESWCTSGFAPRVMHPRTVSWILGGPPLECMMS